MRNTFILFLSALVTIISGQSDEMINPSFEQVLSLYSAGSVTISPDGHHVVYTVRKADWKNNRYDTELWLSKNGDTPFQLTQTSDGSSFNPGWSPDNQFITFVANRGNKNQIHAIRAEGGESFPITFAKEGVQGYEWSPDGKYVYYTSLEAEKKEDKSKSERYGAFAVDDEEYRLSRLYSIPFNGVPPSPNDIPCYDKDSSDWPCIELPKEVAIMDSVPFTIRNFHISPDGQKILFSHSPDPLIMSFMNTDISILDLKDTTHQVVIANSSGDFAIDWSPDGDAFLYSSDIDDRSSNFYKNNKIFLYNLADQSSIQIAADFDEQINIRDWNSAGLFATASIRTEVPLLKYDWDRDEMIKVDDLPVHIGSISFSKSGEAMSFSAGDQKKLFEVYQKHQNSSLSKITSVSDQIDNWKVAHSEVIQWKSKDGAEIEGVVHKPLDFNPDKKYPLLVMIHGGPTGVDRPTPVLSYVYPMNQWVNKGAVVLRVNYRGSAGYGEAFRSLNVENLGVGDAWDVLSGVDHLINQGYIDAEKMGCMGWSQGGYISAFLTTTSDRFKAISVGAGISNWMTYYVNTDIHPFTRQYLKANPWENEEIYRKTSPMTYINDASTPTLIQHGEFDRRVPIPNAYELLQGLQDNDVPAKLVVYKGFGHGITKPKERLAAIWHNWQWFNKYLWDEEIVLPTGEE